MRQRIAPRRARPPPGPKNTVLRSLYACPSLALSVGQPPSAFFLRERSGVETHSSAKHESSVRGARFGHKKDPDPASVRMPGRGFLVIEPLPTLRADAGGDQSVAASLARIALELVHRVDGHGVPANRVARCRSCAVLRRVDGAVRGAEEEPSAGPEADDAARERVVDGLDDATRAMIAVDWVSASSCRPTATSVATTAPAKLGMIVRTNEAHRLSTAAYCGAAGQPRRAPIHGTRTSITRTTTS